MTSIVRYLKDSYTAFLRFAQSARPNGLVYESEGSRIALNVYFRLRTFLIGYHVSWPEKNHKVLSRKLVIYLAFFEISVDFKTDDGSTRLTEEQKKRILDKIRNMNAKARPNGMD